MMATAASDALAWLVILGAGGALLALILAIVERGDRAAERRRERLRERLACEQDAAEEERRYRSTIRREVNHPLRNEV